ncbi:hypothetical protein DGI_2312 [Megalodesulfovibrio gigas DSM 1382 = ATCC 19364]|uniref:Uncharacterized protein n=2 Tax=Megalodesulfovibrio gigas TaxID=879 RepID=T2GD88_MEGG1|nr:hypothetical protein DGI_2312 [Megalodesulfovibrio gigas DSM 1382 = ATCC 19364]
MQESCMTDTFRYPRPPRLAVFLVAAHFCLSLGGLLLHLRIHPVVESYFHWWATGAGLINCLLLPLLFLHPRGVGFACVLNVLTVILGTLGMAYFSLHAMTWPASVLTIILHSTLPDIIILLAKLPLGQMILETMRPHGPRPEGQRGCR